MKSNSYRLGQSKTSGGKIQDPPTKILEASGWANGLNQLVAANVIKDTELSEALNVFYTQYGVISPRQGETQLNNNLGAGMVQAITVHTSQNNNHILIAMVAGILRSWNASTKTWGAVVGSPVFAATGDICLVSSFGFTYVLDGVTHLTKWDGTTWFSFAGLLVPSSLAYTTTGTFSGTKQIAYRVSAQNNVGETLSGNEVVVNSCPPGLTNSSYVNLTWTQVTGAVSYNVYKGDPGKETLLANIPNNSFQDQGQLDSTQSVLFGPISFDQTQGPIANYGVIYKSHLFINDINHVSRAQFSGGGDAIDLFSAGAGGGWIDYNKHDGDKLQAMFAFQSQLYFFKDRSIGAFAFGSLSTPLIQDVNLHIGCVGFRAVCQVEEDAVFLSRRGFFTLGNQPNYINLVRTSELSGIVPQLVLNSVVPSQLSHACLGYFNHTLVGFIPTTLGVTGNSTAAVYNKLYLNWAEWRYASPLNCMVRFVDGANIEHLYGGDAKGNVQELFTGTSDNGIPIHFRAATRKYDMDMPFAYKFIEQIYLTFLNFAARGLTVTFKMDNVSIQRIISLNSLNTNIGWGSHQWGTKEWGIEPNVIMTNALPAVLTKYLDVYQDHLNVQVIFDDNTLNDTFFVQALYMKWHESERPLESVNRLN